MRFFYRDKESSGLMKIEVIKRADIKQGQYTGFDRTIGLAKGSMFEVNSRIMKPGEVIKSKLDMKDAVRRVDASTEAKEYTLVFTSQLNRQLNMIKLYVVKTNDEANVYYHDVAKYVLNSKFGDILNM